MERVLKKKHNADFGISEGQFLEIPAFMCILRFVGVTQILLAAINGKKSYVYK